MSDKIKSLTQYGIDLDNRQIHRYGEGEDMLPREMLISDFPDLAHYYFSHINVYLERLDAVIVEEVSLLPVMLDTAVEQMIRYLDPVFGEAEVLHHTLCASRPTFGWMAYGMSAQEPDGQYRNVIYLTRFPRAVVEVEDLDDGRQKFEYKMH